MTSATPPPHDSPVRGRWLYLALGLFFTGLGVAGAVLPVLPTTPFLLIALWAYSRSSRRLHEWLYRHPRFGPRLQAWHRHRVIPAGVKATALSAMVASLLLMVLAAKVPPAAIAAAGAVMLYGAVFILRRPSRPPE